jgi:NADP-dependent 3-hydroxy acid dehydrogenase YdfG
MEIEGKTALITGASSGIGAATARAFAAAAEPHEQLGEFAQARDAYAVFVAAWQDADPELQPRVEEARAAIQRVTTLVKE